VIKIEEDIYKFNSSIEEIELAFNCIKILKGNIKDKSMIELLDTLEEHIRVANIKFIGAIDFLINKLRKSK